LNLAELLALYDQQQRIDYVYPDMRKEILPHVTRHTRPAPGMSLVLHSRLDETNASQTIQEQIADFTRMQLPFTWKVYQYDQPADLGERLVAAGFEPDDDPPGAIMLLDLQSAPPSLLEAAQGDLRWITHPEGLADVIRVEQQVWGGSFDWILGRMGSHLAIPDYLSVAVAYVEGQPACAGWTYYNLNGNFAGLWGGSTVPEYRQRGLYTALLAARVQQAIRRGYRFLVVEASMMSRAILAKNGFQVMTYATSYDWKIEPR
jgi:GNAT superfamily N-acetyltransferase